MDKDERDDMRSLFRSLMRIAMWVGMAIGFAAGHYRAPSAPTWPVWLAILGSIAIEVFGFWWGLRERDREDPS